MHTYTSTNVLFVVIVPKLNGICSLYRNRACTKCMWGILSQHWLRYIHRFDYDEANEWIECDGAISWRNTPFLLYYIHWCTILVYNVRKTPRCKWMAFFHCDCTSGSDNIQFTPQFEYRVWVVIRLCVCHAIVCGSHIQSVYWCLMIFGLVQVCVSLLTDKRRRIKRYCCLQFHCIGKIWGYLLLYQSNVFVRLCNAYTDTSRIESA